RTGADQPLKCSEMWKLRGAHSSIQLKKAVQNGVDEGLRTGQPCGSIDGVALSQVVVADTCQLQMADDGIHAAGGRPMEDGLAAIGTCGVRVAAILLPLPAAAVGA